MKAVDAYYLFKPLIPRRLQIFLRRAVVSRKRAPSAEIWPIDQKAGKMPNGWRGWPQGKEFALVLTHDVDTADGQAKCHRLIEMEERFGFVSSFNFVAQGYKVSAELRSYLGGHGFEVGVHGLWHDRRLFRSKQEFERQAVQINRYLKEWGSVGFRSPCMYHNLEWVTDLDVEYDASTFDTDPFEPQPDGVGTIFPFWVPATGHARKGYTELPYTLPQDFTVFVLMKEETIDLWKKKLAWIVDHGGMALLNTHPDYMKFYNCGRRKTGEYPAGLYEEFLTHIRTEYEGRYWHVLPREVARFWSDAYGK